MRLVKFKQLQFLYMSDLTKKFRKGPGVPSLCCEFIRPLMGVYVGSIQVVYAAFLWDICGYPKRRADAIDELFNDPPAYIYPFLSDAFPHSFPARCAFPE